MRITLEKMRVTNFKGIRSLEIDFNGHNINISGCNGIGKTSIVDAYMWCIWNENAAGDAPGSDNFREKPLDENGQTIHNLDTVVELFCTLDGQRFDLKRKQVENWVKKRGNAEATFQGNVSTYWINDVETKQSDFKARIKAIADDEVFRFVGSLSAFNQLEWRKRRKQLLTLAGNDVDGALLERDEYRPLADAIAERNISPDEMRKVLADQRKNINNELKLLPVRIDEAKKSLPDIKDSDIKDADYIIAQTKQDVDKIEQMMVDLRANSAGASKRTELLALEQECISIKRRIMDEHEAERRKLKNEADAASDNFLRLTAMATDEKTSQAKTRANLEKAKDALAILRQTYIDCKRKPVTVEDTCPTCGQKLPADKVQETKAKAEQDKRDALTGIQQRGKDAAEIVAQLEAKLTEQDADAAKIEQRVRDAKMAREAANAALRDFPAYPDETASKPLQDAEKRLEALRAEQAESPDEKLRQLTERKRELLAIINRNLTVINKRDIMVDTQQRIKGYEAQQQELGAKLSETDILIALVEQFIQARCGALEDSINSHFPTVRWKLFDTQINGGIVDTCIAMLNCDGVYVPYETANTASQIAADVEIVDVLSEHYGVRVPLFIDNAERVNVIPEINSQTITLSVSTDSELNIKEA